MEEEVDPPCVNPPGGIPVITVTWPTLGNTVHAVEWQFETPVVTLGIRHGDHSESDELLVILSSDAGMFAVARLPTPSAAAVKP
jgi:hypothetical protein